MEIAIICAAAIAASALTLFSGFGLGTLLLPVFAIFFPVNIAMGGLLSGFFGGLSGHQGALRSAFLIRCNLTKESFIATGVVIAVIIDTTRLLVYSTNFLSSEVLNSLWLLLAATLSAFLGAFAGRKLMKKVTYNFVHNLVGVMLIIIAIGLAFDLI